jgi:aryl-phospho-beta-D-glucosidase BglC (GH1 family)
MKKNNFKATKEKLLLEFNLEGFCSKTKILLLVFFLCFMGMYSVSAKSPVDENGKLSVSGNYLVNEQGIPVQLRGMSTHGLQWFTHGYNFNSLSELANNWGIDVIRIAMYPSTLAEDGTFSSYDGNPNYWKGYIDHLVDICGQLGIYCIIDWHVLNPGDPNDPEMLPLAKDFWDYMSKKHAGKKQVLYEICNEPNGATTWLNVKTYANTIIPIIRANDPNSIIIVGSSTWSSDVDKAAIDPILDPNSGLLASNVMYTFHFYAGQHYDSYRNKIDTALSKGLAIFVTEWGTMGANGNGAGDWVNTDKWLSFMQARKR